jgi:hypothetical protein
VKLRLQGRRYWCGICFIKVALKPSSSAAWCLRRRHAILDGTSDLIPQLGGILMPMHCDGMLHGCLQKFALSVGHYRD